MYDELVQVGEPVHWTWEATVVGCEMVLVFAFSIYLYRWRTSQSELALKTSSSSHEAPYLTPRSWCSLSFLVGYRGAVFLFYCFVQLYDAHRTNGLCFAFYTSWNFMLQGAYFFLATIHTYKHYQVKKQQKQKVESTEPLLKSSERWTLYEKKRGFRTALLLDMSLAASILICVVVWTILYPYAKHTKTQEKILNWVSYIQHGGNILLLQIDFWLSNHTVSKDVLPLIIAWPTSYAVFTWILHGTIARGFWPYPFLQLNTPWAPIWYSGILISHLLALGIIGLLSRLKEKCQDQNAWISSTNQPSLVQV